MSTAENVEFRTVVERECSSRVCDHDALFVAIVAGEFGANSLAGYCEGCADWLDQSRNHTFIGRVQR